MEFSQIFYNIAVGVGILFAGFGGLKIFIEWLHDFREKKKRGKLTAELKAQYPKEKRGEIFQLIKSDAKPGYIYLLDFDISKKRHIASAVTFKALGFEPYMVDKLEPDKFNSIEEGDRILIE